MIDLNPPKPFAITAEEVKRRIIAAICDLYVHDHDLLDMDANERSITHKLAEHLQREFARPEWTVDCEYNRVGSDDNTKTLQLRFDPIRPEDKEAKTVFPDIIVHRRRSTDNLIVIEVKKVGGPEDTKDVEKLKQFTSPGKYEYKHGVLLKLGPSGVAELKVYRGGRGVDDWSGEVRNAISDLGL
jgi:hypothetical protein